MWPSSAQMHPASVSLRSKIPSEASPSIKAWACCDGGCRQRTKACYRCRVSTKTGSTRPGSTDTRHSHLLAHPAWRRVLRRQRRVRASSHSHDLAKRDHCHTFAVSGSAFPLPASLILAILVTADFPTLPSILETGRSTPTAIASNGRLKPLTQILQPVQWSFTHRRMTPVNFSPCRWTWSALNPSARYR